MIVEATSSTWGTILAFVGSLSAVLVGWFLHESSDFFEMRREDKRAIGRVLAELLEVRSRLQALPTTIEAIRKKASIAAHDEAMLRHAFDSLFPGVAEGQRRYNEAIDGMAGRLPLLAFRLRSKDIVTPLLSQLRPITLNDPQAVVMMSRVEDELVRLALPQYDELARELAWLHGLKTWWRIRPRLKEPSGVPKEAEEFLSRLIAEAQKLAEAQKPAAERVESADSRAEPEQPEQSPAKATGSQFYRYQSCEHLEWLKPIILDHVLYIPLVSQLNDPLDCKPKINPMSDEDVFLFLRNDYLRRNPSVGLDLLQKNEATIRERLRTLGLEWFLQQMAEIMYQQMDEFRVYSMSKRFDNFSLWAKYADGHKGYCLEFANEGPFFGEHTLDVIYGDYPPFDVNDSKKRNAMFLVYKRRDWCNEEEVRLISKRGSSPYVKINPCWLTRIVLGKDMAAEHIRQIREWAGQRKPQLTVVQARFDALRHELRLIPLSD